MLSAQTTETPAEDLFLAKHHIARWPTVSSVSTASSNGSLSAANGQATKAVYVKNTFIDLDLGRPPSLEEFFRERLIRSAPGSRVEEEAPPEPVGNTAPILLLAEALPVRGGPRQQQPQWSEGSAGHEIRECHPCAFFWKEKGCSSGADCTFCHMCGPGEKKKRQKDKRIVWRGIDRMRQVFFGAPVAP
mmetsp:Transcript_20116/g.35691  ORF Transcript_20116/g.35691 Transcript_20116/m.35691 type:complete len:189 (-) Transcript_20116:163-729(-)|eukprot:CAMPEP_0197642430 /NCGR_PEP_ID=MMETSP1338-20131121/16090_1 /TAXON_ID=43686 ORGANISM="Pelagodinium beii, Strain RCC1491" /NCGR_SAMPLE_ID=MMETSP1338 /ASSEMBLY_ACC=CAM_ASM_000754 /LENGTH=188 /DNA_ID=CAMNT_0043215545 /DNA_START=66 /DNA_END=632 /DNA_ORIENTATION=+